MTKRRIAIAAVFGIALLVLLTPAARDEIRWLYATISDTADDYAAYLEAWPDGRHSSEAQVRIDDAEWEAAQGLEQYRAYLAVHPKGRHVTDAEQAIEQLHWDAAAKTGTLAAFSEYTKQYPAGRYVAEARRHIERLRWAQVVATNSIPGFKKYLRRHPQGEHASTAHENIDRLHWEQADSAGTIAAFDKYLELHPTGRQAAEAKARSADIAFRALASAKRPEPFQDFLARHPGSDRTSAVKKRLEPILLARCMKQGRLPDCDAYLRLFGDQAGAGIVEARRQQVQFGLDLAKAITAGTFDAYRKVMLAHPKQTTLVMFEGGIGGMLDSYIKLSELCPDDLPRLRKIAAKENVAMEKVQFFPGFWVRGPPAKKGEKRRAVPACYPIPQWSAEEMKLFDMHVWKEGNTTKVIMDFSSSAKKRFTFIGRKVGKKYHVAAAKHKRDD